ncbi:MAG: hypothetical protein KFH98_01335 [Gemmatimonadetes bacterium]|nr:hypothetical protein [Gemmatimonadota bacterium]
MNTKIFLLSPASVAGRRAQQLLGQGAFPLAERLRSGAAVPLWEVFSFLSSLYFRGKHSYASVFARPPHGLPGALVITTNRGLLSPDEPVTADDLRAFGAVPIDVGDARYRDPLVRDTQAIGRSLPADGIVVLLGSIASGKYVNVLLDVLGDRLRFPAEFVGRGDMSRGGLLLRCAEDGTELDYVTVAGTPRRGGRPPKLEPRR